MTAGAQQPTKTAQDRTVNSVRSADADAHFAIAARWAGPPVGSVGGGSLRLVAFDQGELVLLIPIVSDL